MFIEKKKDCRGCARTWNTLQSDIQRKFGFFDFDIL
ncbi:hypothetical protein FDG2_3406 [Candidatus Protofrankia californiensis]|uniref:Uncharacterized protein n=1 Tax=Candidatus Protofrankia californiensis TaxID=1839754 RepID=A0A1C3NZK1_9ACTN|nr:hypothetical protein FDG2_3406 [Candidatus Protofrankia californiensis]